MVVAHVADATLVLPGETPAEGTVSLYLEGQARAGDDPAWKQALYQPLSALLLLDADTGWQRLTATENDGKVAWEHDFRRQGMTGWRDRTDTWHQTLSGDATTGWASWLVGGEPTWRRGEITAILQRSEGSAGIAIGGDGANGNGILLLVRPINRDVIAWRLSEGMWQGPLGGQPWLRPWYSALKDLLRLLLRPYFVALALAAGAAALGVVARGAARLTRSMRRSRPGAIAAVPPIAGGAADAPIVDPASRWAEAGELMVLFGVSLLATVVVLVAGVIADTLLERMPHVQDSVAYLFQARVFARGELWAPLPPLPEFFEHEFVVMNGGRWFAKYPPGFPALLSLGVLAGAPWMVNPTSAGLAVLALFALARRTATAGTAVGAAALLALSPFFLILAGSHMAHTTGLLFTLLFVLGYVELDRGSRLGAVLAGVALGVDVLIRPWSAALLALPFGVDLLLRLRRQPRQTLVLGICLALGLLPLLLVYGGYNWVLAGSPFNSTMNLWWTFDKLGFGPDKGIAGHTPLNGLYNTVWNLSLLARHTFGWPAIATFAFAFLPFAAGRATRWDRLCLAGWFCLMTGYYFWWADGVMYGPRFYHEATGFIALLTARGVAELGHLGRLPGRVIGAALTVLLVAVNLAFYLPVQLASLRGYNYVSRARIDAVERANVHNAVVFVDPGPVAEWWNYGMVFSANSPWLDTDVIYARDLGSLDEHLMVHYAGRRFYRFAGDTLVPIESALVPQGG